MVGSLGLGYWLSISAQVADMGITRPEVLRVVPAYHAFQRPDGGRTRGGKR